MSVLKKTLKVAAVVGVAAGAVLAAPVVGGVGVVVVGGAALTEVFGVAVAGGIAAGAIKNALND